MTEEYQHGDDHGIEPYDAPTIPFHHSDSPIENKAESDRTAAQEPLEARVTAPQPSTQGPFLSEHDDPTQVFNPPYFSQAPAVPLALPPTPGKKRGLQLSPRNIVLLALIVLLVLAGAAGLFVYATRSTPSKTLDAFCSSMTKSDAGAAYQQFSPSLQRILPEQNFASTLAHDSITQCSYAPVNEGQASVQTALKLQHGSRGINNDRVTLSKDAHGTWLISDITAASATNVPHKAAVHHLTLSAKQTFSRVAMLFAANGGNMGAGLAVTAGTRIVLFATGTMNAALDNKPVEANGTSSSCPTKALPEAGLNCYATVYSTGSVKQVGLTGKQADFILKTDGVLFFGLNAPEQSQASGSFQLKVLTIPDKTATGLWQQPENNGFLFSKEGHVTLSAHLYSQNYDSQIASVRFYQIGDRGARTDICESSPDISSYEIVTCQWDLRVAGKPIRNGPLKISFSLITSDGFVDDPDGAISGIARYIATQRSYNYSGYSAQSIEQLQPTHYRSSTMSWKVPAVHCSPGEDSLVGIWPGLQGTSSKSQLAQLGTLSGCQNGEEGYAPWWEMYPEPPHAIDNSLNPGDEMVATVSYQQGKFHLTMEDKTQGWHFTTVQNGTDNDTLIAECVVEAPYSVTDQAVVRLSNFGSVSVNCLADNQPIGATGPQNVIYQMVGSQHQATTSNLDQRGANFTVWWGNHY